MSLSRMGVNVIHTDESRIRRGDHYVCNCGTSIITDFGAVMTEHTLADPGQYQRVLTAAKDRGDLVANW